MESPSLRLVSINTWKGDGPYRARLDALIGGLRRLRPDIIVLQEALEARDGGLSTPRTLADALDLTVVYHASREKVRTVEGRELLSWSGLATLSRWPVLEMVARPLPWDPADGERAALICAVATPLGTVRVVNTHLTHLRDSVMRTRQLVTLARDPWLTRPAAVRLVCGDLNATPTSEEIARFREEEAARGWHVRDCLEGLSDAERITMSPRNDYVAARRPAAAQSKPGRAIDHVLSLAPGPEQHPRIVRAEVVLDEPSTRGFFASDHFGVSVVLAPWQGHWRPTSARHIRRVPSSASYVDLQVGARDGHRAGKRGESLTPRELAVRRVPEMS